MVCAITSFHPDPADGPVQEVCFQLSSAQTFALDNSPAFGQIDRDRCDVHRTALPGFLAGH
jgi:hypothetical protein